MARMNRIAPGLASRANLLADLVVIFGATFTSHWLADGLTRAEVRPLFWVATALASTWLVTAAALRQYAGFTYDRDLLDETAMITTLVTALITVQLLLAFAVPFGTPVPHLSTLLPFLWGPAMLLRLLFRQIASREEAVENVLVVGVGPIGRLTAQDRRRHGRHRVVGHLNFSNETEKDLDLLRRCYAADGAECPVLGPASELEQVLRRMPVEEVYIAGNGDLNSPIDFGDSFSSENL